MASDIILEEVLISSLLIFSWSTWFWVLLPCMRVLLSVLDIFLCGVVPLCSLVVGILSASSVFCWLVEGPIFCYGGGVVGVTRHGLLVILLRDLWYFYSLRVGVSFLFGVAVDRDAFCSLSGPKGVGFVWAVRFAFLTFHFLVCVVIFHPWGGVVLFYLLVFYRGVFGPAVCKRGNRVPWSAPVARVHPRTVDHRKMSLRVRVKPDNKHGNGIGRVDMERGPDSV